MGKRDANQMDFKPYNQDHKRMKVLENDVWPILVKDHDLKRKKWFRVLFKPDHVLVSEKFFKIDSEPNAPGLTPSEVDRIQ